MSNTAVGSGGALYLTDDSALTATNVTFSLNSAAYGGALHVATSTVTGSTSSTTTNQYNTTYGSNYDPSATYASPFEALHNTWSVRLQGSNMTGNKATGSVFGGGAMHASNAGRIHSESCTLEDNTAVSNGGAVASVGAATLYVDGATIKNNTAATGGGVSVEGGAAWISNSGFVNNTAISQSLFMGVDGGAVYSTASTVLDTCKFVGNVATSKAHLWGE